MNPTNFYKCLADETRLKSLLLLSHRPTLCVCDLVVALQLSQPKISRHLADLRVCQLVFSERRGKWIHYSLHPQLPQWISQIINLTRDNNPDYIKQELLRLRSSQNCE